MIPIRRVMSMLIVSSMIIGIVPSTSVQSTAPKAHPVANQASSNDLLLDDDDYQVLTSGQLSHLATILPKTDQDIFYIDAEAQQEITIEMQRSADEELLNGELSLFDHEDNLIASDDNSGIDGNPLIRSAVAETSGRYAIWVRDHAGTRTGSYRITATVNEPLVSAAEYSTLNLEADPCPEPAESLELPDLEPTPNQPQNARVTHTNQALPQTNYPLNCEFARDREVLATINPESFSITNANQSFTTDSVTVPETTQMLRFEYMVGRKTADSITPLHIEVLSGANFATVTNISNSRIKSQYRLGWQNGALNIQAFRGQTIKLRFINDWWWTDQPSAQVRNIQLTQEIPDWELSTVGEFAIQNDTLIGAHAVITGANASLTSTPIDITNQTQSLSFNYRTGRWLNDGRAPLFVDILSGPTFTTVTRIDQGTLGGRLTDGWQEAVVDVQAFRGQTIKVKIVNDWWPTEPQVTALDRFMLNWAVPGWDISNASFVRTHSINIPSSPDLNLLNGDFDQSFIDFDVIENAAFEEPTQLVSALEQTPINIQGIKTKATSIEFVVPTEATSVHFEYMLGDLDNPNTTRSLQVAILSGETFDIRELPKGYEFVSSQQTGWQFGRIDLVDYRGKTIKLQFTNASLGKPNSQIRQLQVMQDVPSWHVNNHQLVTLDTHAQYSNHIYVHGNATQLTSFSFTVPLTAQQVRFDYQAGYSHDHAARQSVAISVLSGDHFEVATLLPKNYLRGSANQGWQRLAIDLQRFQGQTIKVRFQLEAQHKAYLRLDNFQVGQLVAGWSFSEHTPISIEPAGTSGQAVRFAGNNATITSDAWQVPTDTQTLQFNYKAQLSDPNARSFIKVHVLSNDDFTVITPIDAKLVSGTANNGWLQAKLDLAQFQGQTIKLQFKSHTSNDAIVWLDQLQLIAGQHRSKQVIEQAPDYSFIEMTQNAQQLTSSSVEVANDSQFLRFVYQVGNKDQGNARHYLAMEVLSGANFTTVTRIDQNQLRASLNDGWKIAQLPIQRFQNQTIKIRFVGPDLVSAPIVRIDKVALLSPRATLTSPITTTGTTYLNVPLTEFGGPTTTAMMTITSLVVYDEYLDMSGFISYENTNFPFEFSGDIYYSVIGDTKDKVLVLQDKLHNFKVINVAARSKSVPAVMTDRFTNNPNLVITLQEHYKYQYTTFTLDNNIISDILEVKAKYGPAYTDDYWHTKIFNPISQSFEEDDVGTHYNSPNQEKSHWYSWVDENETCTIIQQIDFKTYIRGANNIGGGQGTFFATIKITRQRTNGEVRPHMSDTWPSTACDGADSEISGLGLGSDEISLGNDYVLGSDMSDQGDVFQEVEYAAMEAQVLPFYDQEEISIGLRLGSSFGWKPLAIAAALPLGDFGSRTSSSKIGSFPITEIPPPYTLRTNLSITTLYLADINTTAHTEATVACFIKKASNKSYIKINFIIPISHSRNYHRFPERVIYPFYYIDYLSGPC